MEFITNKQESLEQIKRRLELVVESSGVGLWDWNPQTNEVVFDKQWAAMLGLTSDELTQTLADWSDRVHPDDLQGCFDDIAAHVNGQTDNYQNTHRMKHKDGHWVFILDQGTIVERDANGQPIRFTGTHTNVTPFIEAERRARDLLEARDLFFAQITHEIRTPVHAILAAADLLSNEDLDEKITRLLEVVKQSAGGLTGLVDDILDVARLNAGGIRPNIEMVVLDDVVEASVELFLPSATLKGLELKFNSSDVGRVYAKTDKARLKQILDNLLSNAIKYTPRGFVHVSLDFSDNQALISVNDSGIGIDNVDNVFENFTRETQLSDRASTGLGLGIVKDLCHLLGVDVCCRSNLGFGSEFVLTLDAELRSPKPEFIDNSKSNNPIRAIDIKYRRVLLVDDSSFNLYVGEELLLPFFHEVDTASSANQAFLALTNSTKQYDVVLIDINMPDMDGFELAQRIRRHDLLYNPFLVCQTADASAQRKALQDGVFDAFLLKPFGRQEIESILQKIDSNEKYVYSARESKQWGRNI